MVRRVLQESAWHDVFVVVLDDTGRSENEKMNMTVLNALRPVALTITHGISEQAYVIVYERSRIVDPFTACAVTH